MYEEKKFSGRKIHWLSVLIKLALLFLIVFLVWYFIIRSHDNKNDTKKLGAKISDNISYLKKQYLKYFNEENVPKNTNDESKVTLKELIDTKNSKIIYDKNGEKCSSSSSYGKLVKTDKDTYELKVYLKCKNEADSELYTITRKEIIDTTNKNNDSKNNKDNKDNKDNKTQNNTNSNKDLNNSNTNNQNDKSKNTNNNTNKTNTSNNSNKSNSSTTTKQTNTTTTTKQTSTTSQNSTTKQTTTSQTSTTTTNKVVTETTKTQTSNTVAIDESKLDVEKITSDPSRIVLTEYLLYKLGNGSYTRPDGVKFITYEQKVDYYKYCNNEDMVNCHTNFAKTEANKKAISELLDYGYTEYFDHSEEVLIYIPIIDEMWNSSKEKDGYVYSGKSRTHYRVN